MSDYRRLEVEAGQGHVSMWVDGRHEKGSRWLWLSPLDAKAFSHRLLAEAYEVERLALKNRADQAAAEAAEEELRRAEEEARRQAEAEVPSSAAVETGREPDPPAL